jgi:undecaprenyl-diphosphatase
MDFLVQHFASYGMPGLFIIAFAESVFSPILPDLLLIPMALALPEKAIDYGMVATAGSVLGGLVGYTIGKRVGLPALKRFVPPRYVSVVRSLADQYGAWTVFIGALSPIPYKFITITSGVLRIKLPVFIAASIGGRAKRFILEGILIFYYGPRAVEVLQGITFQIKIMLVAVAIIAGGLLCIKLLRRPCGYETHDGKERLMP